MMDNLFPIFCFAAVAFLTWFSWRYAWWCPSVDQRHPRILMYHMIRNPIPGARFNGMRVSPGMFEKQIKWLKQQGWHFHTVDSLIRQWPNLPEKSVAITFDDGYADNAIEALPILQKYEAKGTVYLVVERHRGDDWSANKKAKHNSGELIQEPKLSDQQVRELTQSQCVEIGSHTLTHPNFSLLDTEAKREEIIQSKHKLEEQFGVDIKTFAYPFGIFHPEDPGLVKEAGYLGAVTTESGITKLEESNPYRLKRIKISGKEGMLAFKIRMRTGRRGANK